MVTGNLKFSSDYRLAVSTEYYQVLEGCSVYQVKQGKLSILYLPSDTHLPSHQWLLSSELLRVASIDQAFTSTKCMMMLSNVVDAEYQNVTELV